MQKQKIYTQKIAKLLTITSLITIISTLFLYQIVLAAEGDFTSFFSIGGSGNNNPYGLTTDGTNIWIVDTSDDVVYKYNMSGTYDSTWTVAGGGNPRGITTDSTNIWHSDSVDREVYKFDMDGVYQGSWDTNASGNSSPTGIATDGTNIWVADSFVDKVFKYDMNGVYQSSWDTTANGLDNPTGLTTDGNYIWVVDSTDLLVYKFDMDGVYQNVSWAATNIGDETPYGIGFDGTNFYIADNKYDRVNKYNGPAPTGTTNTQTGQLPITCSATAPAFTLTPAAMFDFYGDGSSSVIYSSSSAQQAFNNPDAADLETTGGTDYLAVVDVRDPADAGCNDGLTLTVTVQDSTDGDGLIFETDPDDSINGPGNDDTIELQDFMVVSSSDNCAASATENAAGDICFDNAALCGEGSGTPAAPCTDEGLTNVNYNGNSFATWATFTGNGATLGTNESPVPITLMLFTNDNELYGTAGLAAAYGVNIDAGDETGTYVVEILYTLTGN